MAGRPDPQAEDRPEDRQGEDHLVDPEQRASRQRIPWRTTRRRPSLQTAGSGHPREPLAMDCVHQEEDLELGTRGVDQQDSDRQERRRRRQRSERAANRQVRSGEAEQRGRQAAEEVGQVGGREAQSKRPREQGKRLAAPSGVESGDSWGPGPDPGRSCGRLEAPPSDQERSNRRSARRSNLVPPPRIGEEGGDEWLSADYRRRRDCLLSLVQPKRLRLAPEPAPPAYGRYGALRNEVSKEGTEWDIKGPDGDTMEDFRISPPRGSDSRSYRQREEEEYMEGVRRRVLGGAYAEEPRRSRLDFEEEMHMAAVGTPLGPPVGALVDLPTGLHGLQGRCCRRMGRPERHQAPHVRWEPPQPRPLPGEAEEFGDVRHRGHGS